MLVTLLNQLKGAKQNSCLPSTFPMMKVGIKIIERAMVCSEYDPVIVKPQIRKHIPTPTVKIIFARWILGERLEETKYITANGPPGIPNPPVTTPAKIPAIQLVNEFRIPLYVHPLNIKRPTSKIKIPIPVRINSGLAAVKNIKPNGIANDIPMVMGAVSLQLIFFKALGTSIELPRKPAAAAMAMPSMGV